MKNKRLENMLSDLSLYSQPARSATDWAEVMVSLRDVKPRQIVKMYGKYPTAENISDHAALMREWNAVYRKASASQKAALLRDNAAFHASRSVERNPRKMINIEKSGFHRGEYVGYGAGTVWKIRRSAQGWTAYPREYKGGGVRDLHAASLAEMSSKLDKLDHPIERNPRKYEETEENPKLKKRPATAMFLELRDGSTGLRIGPVFDLKHTSMPTIKAAAQGYHARTGHAISAHRVTKK